MPQLITQNNHNNFMEHIEPVFCETNIASFANFNGENFNYSKQKNVKPSFLVL